MSSASSRCTTVSILANESQLKSWSSRKSKNSIASKSEHNFFLNSKRLRKAFIFASCFITLNPSYQRSNWIAFSRVQGWKPSSPPSCLNRWVFHSMPEKVSIYSDWAVFQITCTLRPLGPLRSVIYVHTDAFNPFKMYECLKAACIDGCECASHWRLDIRLECSLSRSSTKIVLKSEEVQCEPDGQSLILLLSRESRDLLYLGSHTELAVHCDKQHPKYEQWS